MLEIKEVNISQLLPYKNNPRNNKEAIKYVKKSIEQFGFLVPIIIDKQNNIICGHTRFEAAKLIGLKKVPCIMAENLSDTQINAFRLVDNKSQEISTWDFTKLEEELQNLIDVDFDISQFEFDLPDFIKDIDEVQGLKKYEDCDEQIDERKCIKILFDSIDSMNNFLDIYREQLINDFGCNITVTK